ncbi:MAG: hypothetical protein Q8O56_12010 [Solirubrobacteraceae bacterium]|nr:hypothetical protein [Solirubrobacteraceae bacterium]
MADAALWIMVIVLAVVVLLLMQLLKRVLAAATSIPAKIDAIAGVAAAASKDLDAVAVLLTTQGYIGSIKNSVLDYGGSLNAALPDY